MTALSDILNVDLLLSHVADGNVRSQVHPEFKRLRIFNYTEKCTWDKAWDSVTLQCRGLIVDASGEVLARPLTKFFNHGQEGAPELTLDTRVHVTEKMDGSMGILYRTPDGKLAIATRGSFASEQAIWATEYFRANYADWSPDSNATYIFEIIYPENRIVVDYGDREGLVLLAVVDIRNGETTQPQNGQVFWPGEQVEVMPYKTYGEVIASEQRSNHEGFVLWNIENDWRVKIKHEEYMILHRFMTNTSPKNIWEVLSTGQDPAEVFALAPDEFHEWMKGVIERLQGEYDQILSEAQDNLSYVISKVGHDAPRKDFAAVAIKLPNSGIIFKLLDGHGCSEAIWKLIKPRGDEKMVMKPVNPDAD